MNMQVATSSSRVTRRRAANLKTNLRRTLSMMGAKRKKRRGNVFKRKRDTSAPARRWALAWILPKPSIGKMKARMSLIPTLICQRKKKMENGDSTRQRASIISKGGSGCQPNSSTVFFPTSEKEWAGSTICIRTRWAACSVTIWA